MSNPVQYYFGVVTGISKSILVYLMVSVGLIRFPWIALLSVIEYKERCVGYSIKFRLLQLSLVAAMCMTALDCSAAEAGARVDGQPLAANAKRLLDALTYLGHPLNGKVTQKLQNAVRDEDARKIQSVLDKNVLFEISINPELRVKVARGSGDSLIQQAGYTPCLIKVNNEATVTRSLRIASPQAGPVYAGPAEGILKRQAQTDLNDNENLNQDHRFLDVEIFDKSPMTSRLSGLEVEYLIALVYSSEAGQREATIVFDIGQGTQDLGFRSEVPVLFTIRPALPVKLKILDYNGQPDDSQT